MSPTEDELRSALRRGEGDTVDPQRVVSLGAAARARRRGQVGAITASAAAVVVAVSVGVALGRSHGPRAYDDSAGGAATAGRYGNTAKLPARAESPGGGAAAPSGGPVAPSDKTSLDAPHCPATFPQRALPGGGSPGQFGADGDLFPSGVRTIVVCDYGTPLRAAAGSHADSLTLSGSDAALLRTSLESAATAPTGASCTDVRPTAQRQLALVGLDASGEATRVVTTTVGIPVCDTRTTNGTAVRWAWTPPSGLGARIAALDPTGGATGLPPRPQPSGKNIGSPVR